MHPSRCRPGRASESELGIIAMFRDEAPYLVEWVEYHRLAGVTRFWLYDHLSADGSVSVLAPYVADGVVTVVPWRHPHRPGDLDTRRRIQMFAIQDGLRRAIGQVDWVAVIDVDEFLLPTSAGADAVPRCLDEYFVGADAIYVNWRMFGTNRVVVPAGDPILPSLTACSLPLHPENRSGKSLVRPERVSIDRAWYPHHVPLLPGARYVDTMNRELSRDRRGDLVVPIAPVDGMLRVNHYTLRDDGYFRSRRLPEARMGRLNKSLGLLLEHHESFGRMQDRAILDFLERRRNVGGPGPSHDV